MRFSTGVSPKPEAPNPCIAGRDVGARRRADSHTLNTKPSLDVGCGAGSGRGVQPQHPGADTDVRDALPRRHRVPSSSGRCCHGQDAGEQALATTVELAKVEVVFLFGHSGGLQDTATVHLHADTFWPFWRLSPRFLFRISIALLVAGLSTLPRVSDHNGLDDDIDRDDSDRKGSDHKGLHNESSQ